MKKENKSYYSQLLSNIDHDVKIEGLTEEEINILKLAFGKKTEKKKHI